MFLDAGKASGRRRRDTISVFCSSAHSLFVFALFPVLLGWICVSASTSTQIDTVDSTASLAVTSVCAPFSVASAYALLVVVNSPFPLVAADTTDPVLVVASPCTTKNANTRSTKPEGGFSSSALFNVCAAPPPLLAVSSTASQPRKSPLPVATVVKAPTLPLLWSRRSLQSRRQHLISVNISSASTVTLTLFSHQDNSVSSTTAAPLHGCSDELCASPITPWEAPPSASGLLIPIAAPLPFISHVECSSSVRLSVFNAAAIVTRHLYTSDTTTIYVTSSTETLQGSDHLLGFGLYAESSIVKLSFKATTPPKISHRFDIGLVICRNVSVTPHILVAVPTVQECGFARFDCYYVTEAFPTHYTVSSIDGSSQSHVVTNVQECGHARSSYYFTAASLLQYAVSSIDGSSHSRLYDPPTLFLAARTTVQECGLARTSRYYVTAATPTHYAVSSIDGSSQICLCDSLTGTASLYRGSWTSRSQNPLDGFFNVIFDYCAFLRTRALGIQVKFLYGFLLSLTTSIPYYVLVIFVYQFTVEDLSVCNELKLFGF